MLSLTKAIEEYRWSLADVSDHLNTNKMCIKVLEKDLDILVNVAGSFVRLKLVKICHDDENYCNDNELSE